MAGLLRLTREQLAIITGGDPRAIRAFEDFFATLDNLGKHAATHEPGGSDTMTVDAAATVGSLRTLGTGAAQACAGNDPRLSSLPPGVILPYGGAAAPSAFLLCDGTNYLRADYPDLFTALGGVGSPWGLPDGTHFNVPDLRGMFLRGVGSHGSMTMADGNAYAGPALGAGEDDQMQGHYHGISGGGSSLVGYDGAGAFSLSGGAGQPARSIAAPITDGTNGTPRTGDETRPVAIGVNYIVKT